MSPEPDPQRAPLAVDELARVVLELAAEPELAPLIARFTERVRAWAAPSALVAAVRGPQPGTWRVLPALSFGSLPFGIERALQQLVEEVPECLARPTVQQPLEPVAGVKLRDNWIVPWWCDGESGLLLLRGVPRPYPPNLGEALALVSAPVWPRILGGPASRVESLVAQLQQVSGQLQLEATRELQRLQAAAAAAAAAEREAETPPPSEPPRPPEADPAELSRLQAEVGRLEEELRAATEQLHAATELLHAPNEPLLAASEQLHAANEQLRAANEQLRAAGEETAELRGQAAQLQDQAALLQQQAARQAEENAALAERLHLLEEQRGTVRVAEARARVAEEALAAAQEAIASHAGVLRDEREATVARVEEHRRALEAAEQRAFDGEQALAAARKDLEAHSELLDAERAAVEREEEQRRASEAAAAAVRRQSESLRAQLEAAQAELAAARADLAAAQGRAAAEQERARSADETLALVRTALVSLHRSAFVPSGLRFALEDVSAALDAGAPRLVQGMRVVILDRDLGGLESLASELEAGGLDVRIANYPEELALLLRTPGARDVVAAICDVMAFRPDQNIAGLFRSWEKDRPGLTFFLSYDADSSVELERARRVPLSLTLAHLPRPLPAKRVGEAIELLARRQARP